MSLSILMHWVQKFWLWGRLVREEPTPVSDLMSGHLIREHIIETAKENESQLANHHWV